MFQRILIIRTDRIGDVVVTTPALRAIHQAYPQANVTMMVAPQTVDLVMHHPYLDRVIIDDRQGVYKGFIGFLQLCRRIRKCNFDLAVIFHTKRRYNLACFLAGVPIRVGFKNNKFGALLTRPLKDERMLGLKHEAEYCMDVVKAIGAKSVDLEQCIAINPQAQIFIKEWLAVNVPEGFGLVVIHPGASDESKCWPVSHFVSLIDQINSKYLVKVVLVGSGKTALVAKEIASRVVSAVIDMSDQFTLAQTAALLRHSRILVSNDSGPVHMASAVNCAVVSLFLRTQPGLNPERWKPLGDKAVVLANKEQEAIQINRHSQVIAGQKASIAVDEVMCAVDELLRKDIQESFVW